MTKTILLWGGPDDGKIETVSKALTIYTVLRPLAPGKMILIGFERGYYHETERNQDGRQVFEWQGWEGEKN